MVLCLPTQSGGMEIFMKQKRVVTIQDISCFGKCSITVALPVISAMGVETAVIPTAVLSTHTGGFGENTFRDLSEDIESISAHWKSLGMNFDVIYTGYLATRGQIEAVSGFIDKFKRKKTLVLIDPAMADNGKMYSGLDMSFAKSMLKLCEKADIVVPNVTEAAFMLGVNYIHEGYNKEYIHMLLKKLCENGAKNAMITGVSFNSKKIGVVFYSAAQDNFKSYFTKKTEGSFHGTGDVFASSFAGALAQGFDVEGAMRLAADFVAECIKATVPHKKEHWYGVRFEDCIAYLATETKKKLSEEYSSKKRILRTIVSDQTVKFKLEVMGERIRELRAEKNISQNLFAQEIGVPRSVVAAWETGNRIPDGMQCLAMSQFFGVTCDYMLGFADDRLECADLRKL